MGGKIELSGVKISFRNETDFFPPFFLHDRSVALYASFTLEPTLFSI